MYNPKLSFMLLFFINSLNAAAANISESCYGMLSKNLVHQELVDRLNHAVDLRAQAEISMQEGDYSKNVLDNISFAAEELTALEDLFLKEGIGSFDFSLWIQLRMIVSLKREGEVDVGTKKEVQFSEIISNNKTVSIGSPLDQYTWVELSLLKKENLLSGTDLNPSIGPDMRMGRHLMINLDDRRVVLMKPYFPVNNVVAVAVDNFISDLNSLASLRDDEVQQELERLLPGHQYGEKYGLPNDDLIHQSQLGLSKILTSEMLTTNLGDSDPVEFQELRLVRIKVTSDDNQE